MKSFLECASAMVAIVLLAGTASAAETMKAEAPGLAVIRRAVRNPVRSLRQGKKVRSEFSERHSSVNGDAVIQHVKTALVEIHNPFPCDILDVGVPDIPFLRNCPVEHLGSTRDFM